MWTNNKEKTQRAFRKTAGILSRMIQLCSGMSQMKRNFKHLNIYFWFVNIGQQNFY